MRPRGAVGAAERARLRQWLVIVGQAVLLSAGPACREEFTVLGIVSLDGGTVSIPGPGAGGDGAVGLGLDGGSSDGAPGRDAAVSHAPPDGAIIEPGPASAAASGPSFELEPGPRDGFCAGTGSALRVVGEDPASPTVPSGSSCAAALGRTLFTRAVCTCQDMVLGGGLTVDAFDSSSGPYTEGIGGAAVGVNGSLAFASTPVGVLGSLDVAGPGGLVVEAPGLEVGGDLAVGGPLDALTANVHVARDLVVAGDIQGGPVGVGRRLRLPPDGDLGAATTASEVVREAITVPPPCACGAVPDIAALVARARDDNDNALDGLSTGPLTIGLAAQLNCGRFFVEALNLAGNATLSVAGRTAVFVAGDLTIGGNVALVPDATGELDLFVGATSSCSAMPSSATRRDPPRCASTSVAPRSPR